MRRLASDRLRGRSMRVLALLGTPVPRPLMVAMVLVTVPTTVSLRAVRAIAAATAARQWTEAGSGEDIPRGETRKDVDISGPDHPLLGVDVPVTDVSSGQFERDGLTFARRQHDLLETSQSFDGRDILG